MVAKVKEVFFCKECGSEQPKWFGRCPDCGVWGSAASESVVLGKSGSSLVAQSITGERVAPVAVSKVTYDQSSRIDMGMEEVNRVLGGGLVEGSLVLLGGEPGIGKSTLSLQLSLINKNLKTLYVSGEESASQIKLRAERLGGGDSENCLILTETSVDNIVAHIKNEMPQMVIIDSIQTLYSEGLGNSPGGVSQIRECAGQLLRVAKQTRIPMFIIGHITKDGSIAGPKILEHIVDVVLQFEGDSNHIYRVLRGIKNRFGATSEIGVFEMRSEGMVEIHNPSAVLLTHFDEELSGIAVGAAIEGVRSYLIETQALVSGAAYGVAQRSATGFDSRRLNMLLAVIEKRIGYKMQTKDVFLNIAGGFKVNDPGLDMAIVASVMSSALDISIPKNVAFAGEIGLSGEVRPASRTDARVAEAARLGFKKIVVSKYAQSVQLSKIKGIEIVYISKVEEIVKRVLKEFS